MLAGSRQQLQCDDGFRERKGTDERSGDSIQALLRRSDEPNGTSVLVEHHAPDFRANRDDPGRADSLALLAQDAVYELEIGIGHGSGELDLNPTEFRPLLFALRFEDLGRLPVVAQDFLS